MKVEKIYDNYNHKQFDEAYLILIKRLKANNINLSIIKNKIILNICDPSGRYTRALYKLGAKVVHTYNETSKPLKWDNNLLFKKINLDNKFNSKQSYDFIFCNGILSHKKNWRKIIINLNKILKKNGYLWISLYAYGKHWEYADKFKKNLKKIDYFNFKKALELRSWEPNKINFLVELFFSNRIYFDKQSIEKYLNKNNFIVVKFLERGISTDLNEMIYKDKKLKKLYGLGEIRLIAKKC